jgi:hypothetical protein
MHARFLRLPLAVALGAALIPAAASARVEPTPLASEPPACTLILVQLDGRIDSANAHAGDVFRFHSIDTIVTSDGVTIPNNTRGYGIVAFASSAGAHGKPGDLIVEARYLDVAEHGPYHVMIDALSQTSRATGPTGNAAPALSAIPLPFVGAAIGAFDYFHAGKNAVIASGTRFDVVPVDNLSHGLRCSL